MLQGLEFSLLKEVICLLLFEIVCEVGWQRRFLSNRDPLHLVTKRITWKFWVPFWAWLGLFCWNVISYF